MFRIVFVAAALVSSVAAANPATKADQAVLDKGKAAFAIHCASCHGEKGEGNGPAAAALNPKPRNFSTDPFKQGESHSEVFKSISTGVPNTPMVAFAHLSEPDRQALTHWVLELRGASKPVAAPAAPTKPEAKKAKK